MCIKIGGDKGQTYKSTEAAGNERAKQKRLESRFVQEETGSISCLFSPFWPASRELLPARLPDRTW